MMNMPAVMILPSMACQAGCRYCFGPHQGAVMTAGTARETVRFVLGLAEETGSTSVDVIFHGGEPLTAPTEIWEILLEGLKSGLKGRTLRMSLQSNLWNLTDAYLELFIRYGVRIGTSLDGPEEVCDLNRGKGYFARTRASMLRAEAAGIPVSAIATVTRQTLPFATQILEFFRDNAVPGVLHAAVPELGGADDGFSLSADEYASLIIGLYPWYIENRKRTKNETLDHFVRCLVKGRAEICTFRDCLGMFLAVSPEGDITSCQRLAGKEEYRLGSIFDRPSLAWLMASPAADALRARQERVRRECAACSFYTVCRGGCYYNAAAAGRDTDPRCSAYKKIFSYLQERLAAEMASPENMQEVLRRPFAEGRHPLLRKGGLISLAYDPHPSRIAANARKVLAVYALGRYPSAQEAARWLTEEGICGDAELTRGALQGMKDTLLVNRTKRNNCYLHVTLACSLHCSHCYADAGQGPEMPAADIGRIADEALASGFRQLIITGGEPTEHTRWDELTELLKKRKGKGMNLVLRTSLYGCLTDGRLLEMAGAFDQVVVSIDGDEQTHDRRRGPGAYRSTVGNARRYAALCGPDGAELSLACVLSAEEINGPAGDSVRALGRELKVRRIRFRPVLPLGRAASSGEKVMCEGILEHESDEERLTHEIRPLATCGIGQNIFIRPDGRCYPCYAWCGGQVYLGSVHDGPLGDILESTGFRTLQTCTVDTVRKCRDCEFRYLCGGACRAWGGRDTADLNAAPPDCGHLKERAQRFVSAARRYLETE